MSTLRLGVNIDHVATLRNARGGAHPDPLRAAQIAHAAGADGITLHLREDRRHIRDADVKMIRESVALPLNFEMAATAEMQAIALSLKPHACCLVPEKREERTTEGGLDVVRHEAMLHAFIAPLNKAGIRVSLFIAPDLSQVEAANRIGAPVVELHTGEYAHTPQQRQELEKIAHAARHAHALGIEVHAGHGLTYDNVQPIAAIPEIRELNIGHFLIGEALFLGLEASIRQMRQRMDAAR